MSYESTTILFWISVKETSGSHQYACLQFMDVTSPLDTVDERLRFLCLRYNTADKMDFSVRRSTGSSEKEGLTVE